jgi:hypothetical protein
MSSSATSHQLDSNLVVHHQGLCVSKDKDVSVGMSILSFITLPFSTFYQWDWEVDFLDDLDGMIPAMRSWPSICISINTGIYSHTTYPTA